LDRMAECKVAPILSQRIEEEAAKEEEKEAIGHSLPTNPNNTIDPSSSSAAAAAASSSTTAAASSQPVPPASPQSLFDFVDTDSLHSVQSRFIVGVETLWNTAEAVRTEQLEVAERELATLKEMERRLREKMGQEDVDGSILDAIAECSTSLSHHFQSIILHYDRIRALHAQARESVSESTLVADPNAALPAHIQNQVDVEMESIQAAYKNMVELHGRIVAGIKTLDQCSTSHASLYDETLQLYHAVQAFGPILQSHLHTARAMQQQSEQHRATVVSALHELDALCSFYVRAHSAYVHLILDEVPRRHRALTQLQDLLSHFMHQLAEVQNDEQSSRVEYWNEHGQYLPQPLAAAAGILEPFPKIDVQPTTLQTKIPLVLLDENERQEMVNLRARIGAVLEEQKQQEQQQQCQVEQPPPSVSVTEEAHSVPSNDTEPAFSPEPIPVPAPVPALVPSTPTRQRSDPPAFLPTSAVTIQASSPRRAVPWMQSSPTHHQQQHRQRQDVLLDTPAQWTIQQSTTSYAAPSTSSNVVAPVPMTAANPTHATRHPDPQQQHQQQSRHGDNSAQQQSTGLFHLSASHHTAPAMTVTSTSHLTQAFDQMQLHQPTTTTNFGSAAAAALAQAAHGITMPDESNAQTQTQTQAQAQTHPTMSLQSSTSTSPAHAAFSISTGIPTASFSSSASSSSSHPARSTPLVAPKGFGDDED